MIMKKQNGFVNERLSDQTKWHNKYEIYVEIAVRDGSLFMRREPLIFGKLSRGH